ncbi:MAG: NAD(P)/FAD-dependent oxidoreductase [Bryobacteraceae bacterium]
MRALESRAADVTWRMAGQTAGDGWFRCGDAAAVLDPSSSQGVLRAIMTGIRAAHLAIGALQSAITPGEAAIAYHCWLREWLEHRCRPCSQYETSAEKALLRALFAQRG